MPPTESAGNAWLPFALSTVAAWGLYGVLLHAGQMGMADPQNGRYKAFLWVGIAYFLIAILGPLLLLFKSGAGVSVIWDLPGKGIWLSLLAGAVGAIGAFCVLLAFGAKGSPPVVMSIVFAGAPIVNAVVSLALHPPAGGWGTLRWQFYAGILLAAAGGTMVTLFKPGPGKPPATSTAQVQDAGVK